MLFRSLAVEGLKRLSYYVMGHYKLLISSKNLSIRMGILFKELWFVSCVGLSGHERVSYILDHFDMSPALFLVKALDLLLIALEH